MLFLSNKYLIVDCMMNFFDSARNDTLVFEDRVFGFRAAAPALLTNKIYGENHTIKWDPEKMKIENYLPAFKNLRARG